MCAICKPFLSVCSTSSVVSNLEFQICSLKILSVVQFLYALRAAVGNHALKYFACG